MMPGDVRGDIFDVKRFAIHDGPGIRTTVFFRGCPLSCLWCHNPEARVDRGKDTYRKRSIDMTLPAGDNVIGPSVRLETLMREIEKDMVFYEESGGGVTVSGGEPMTQMDFLEGLLSECRGRGIGTALDTSAHAPWRRFERILELVDLFMVDLKLIDDGMHSRYTGVSNALILDNFEKLVESGSRVEARLPMIPGITDTGENLDALLEFIGRFEGLEGVSLLPYNRMCEDKFRRMGLDYEPGPLEPQTPREMSRIAGMFEASGMRVRIGG